MTSNHPGPYTIDAALSQKGEDRNQTLRNIIDQSADITLVCALALDSIMDHHSSEWLKRMDSIQESVLDATSKLLFECWENTRLARYLLDNEGATDAPLL